MRSDKETYLLLLNTKIPVILKNTTHVEYAKKSTCAERVEFSVASVSFDVEYRRPQVIETGINLGKRKRASLSSSRYVMSLRYKFCTIYCKTAFVIK